MKYDQSKNYSCLVASIDTIEQLQAFVKSVKFTLNTFKATSSPDQLAIFLKAIQLHCHALIKITNDLDYLLPELYLD